MATREENYDGIVVPGIEYVKNALFKIHLWNAGTADEAKAQQGFFTRLLEKGVPWFGFDGKPQPQGSRQFTSLATFLGYSDYNQAKLEAKLDAVMAGLGQLKPELQALMREEFDRSLSEGLGTYEFRRITEEDS